jgi:DNA-binding GntR family transcriptional regulator
MSLLQDDALETLANQVYAWLAEQVLTGELRPGQWISENEIAAHVGVSRSPVREALRALGREGIVEAVPRRGTRIAEFTAADVDGLYRTRELVDPEMARLAVENMGPDGIASLERLAAGLHEADGNLDVYYQSTERLWNTLTESCPNGTMADVSVMLWKRAMRFRGIALAIPEFQPPVIELFDALAKHAGEHDGAAAKAAMARMVSAKREILLDRLFLQVSGGREVTRIDP